jgi:polysaccharide biosynthesis transport protein
LQAESGLSLGDYLAAVKRRRFLMVIIALPIVVIGLVLALALPDTYRAIGTFRLVTDRIAETTVGGANLADQYVFSLADKVLTGTLFARIVAEVDPYPDLDEADRYTFARLRQATAVRMVTQKFLETGGREQLIHIGFTVSFDHRQPETAQQVASALSQAFIDVSREELLQAATNKVNFFSGEEARISQQIAELEQRLAAFKSANFDRLPESAQANITTRGRLEQELDGVEREVRTLQQNRVFVAQQLRQAQAGPAAGNLRQLEEEYARKAAIYADTHPDLVALRRQIDQLRQGGSVATGTSLQAQLEQQRAVLAEARQRYSDDHPDIRRMQRNIESLEARVAAGETVGGETSVDTLASMQFQTQLNAIDTQIGGLQARAGSLRSRLAQLEAQLGATPEVEREYQEISRGLGSARDQFTQMANRRLDAEVDIAAITDGAADRFTLFAAPTTPWTPVGPPRVGIVIVSVLLALMFSLAAVVIGEALDTSVRGSRDMRGLLGRSPLGVVPEVRNSVRQARRRRRVAALAGSVIIGAPTLYFLVHLMTA